MGNKRKNTSKTSFKKTSKTPAQNTSPPSKSTKYNIPDGSKVDQHGNLILPGLSSSSSAVSMQSYVNIQRTTKSPKTVKIKPVIVDADFKTLKDLLESMELTPMPLLRILRKNIKDPKNDPQQTKIECSSLELKIAVIKRLTEEDFAFHTHSDCGKRTKLFVLKNFYKIEISELLQLLQNTNPTISKVSILFEHNEHPIYLVHSNDENLTIQELQKNHKTIDSLIVTWEKFDLRRKRPMPCRRCKMWGHAASNCHREYRCIKCDEKHEPGLCKRQNKKVGSPKCVNCGGDHPANSTNCSSYQKYLQNIQKRRSVKRVNIPQFQKNPYSSQVPRNFPVGSATYSEVTKSSLNPESRNNDVTFNNNIGFADLCARFKSIPNIDRTMQRFSELITKLSSTDSEQERSLILVEYCMF